MAGPWDNYATPAPATTPQAASAGPWTKYGSQPAKNPMPTAAPVDQSYTGEILPFSKDAQGNVHFDSNAGLLGSIKRSFMLPGDVMAGKVDPLSQEGIGRSLEFATTMSPVNPAVSAGDRAIPGVGMALKSAEVTPPTAEALKSAASAGYDQMRNMGVDYSSDAVSKLSQALQAKLEQDGVLKELAPKTFTVLDKLSQAPDGSVAPITGLEAARRAFQNAGRDFNNPTDQMAAGRAKEGIDKFISAADPATVVAGPAGDAAKVLEEARGNYAAGKRSDTLTGVQDAAELSAAAANSGQNLGNSIRQRVKSVLLSPKKSAGFTDDELGKIRSVVEGSPLANTARYAGNLLGGGGGLGGILTGTIGAGAATALTGSPVAGIAGAALPLTGYGAKELARILTERGLQQADNMTRARSPLHEAMLAATPKVAISGGKRAALVRALLMQKQDYQQQQ